MHTGAAVGSLSLDHIELQSMKINSLPYCEMFHEESLGAEVAS